MSTYEALRYNFSGSAITALNGSNIASGTVAEARLADLAASKITSGTFADARLSSSSVTQHVDLSNLNASNLTSGTVPNARISSGSVTQHVTSISQTAGSWTPTANGNGFSSATGRYFKIGKLVYVVARWEFPTGNVYGGSSAGIGAGVSTAFTVSGLPFTAANTSNPVLNSRGSSHVEINLARANSYIAAVVYHNTSAIRFFAGSVPYNSSYNTDSATNTMPYTGYEMSVANTFVRSNDSEQRYGGCSFVYYTD